MLKGEKIPRISKACDQCSRYRRKCDGKSPCSLCLQKKRICGYAKIARKRGPEPKLKLNKDAVDLYPTPCSSKNLVGITNTEWLPMPEQLHLPTPGSTPAALWTKFDFLSTIVIDSQGQSGSILDMYYAFSYQHIPILSRKWLNNNLNDVPMHVLHVMYMSVLLNAKQAVPNGRQIAQGHIDFVKRQVIEEMEEIDPFLILTLLKLAMCGLYTQDTNQSILYLGMAIRGAQMLGLDSDVDLYWKSSSSGRVLGGEVGLDKQFLRSVWFMLYMFDHHNIFVFQSPMMIVTVIPDSMLVSFVAPNEGDSSNIPLNFLSHAKYSLPILSIGKEICMVSTHQGRLELLYKLDKHYNAFPYSHHPGWAVQRSLSWINEVFYYSKFCLLVPLYLGIDSIPFDKNYIPHQLEFTISAVLDLARQFIDFSENQVATDPTLLFLSKTFFVAALALSLLGNARTDILDVFQEAIRLTNFPQDYGVVRGDRNSASKALVDQLLLSF